MPDYSLQWILRFARAALANAGNFYFSGFVNAMWQEMEKAGLRVSRRGPFEQNNPNSQYLHNSDPEELKLSAVEAWCYLVNRGYLVPHDSNFPSSVLNNMQYVRTPKGLRWSKGVEPLPEDPSGYMDSVRGMVSPLDSVIEQYLAESVNSFEDRHFFAAAVMVGAAAEKCLYLLAEAMLASLKTTKLKSDLDSAYKRRKLNNLFESVQKIVSAAKQLPSTSYDVFEGDEEQLLSIFRAVQVQRNDAVHPMDASVSDDAVRLTLLAFPYALQKTETLRLWFHQHPGVV